MMRTRTVATTALLGIVAGCSSVEKLTPDQKAAANNQWNAARAGALSSLATDQYKDGSFDKCQQTLGQALAMQPNDANLRILAAKLAIEQGHPDVAEEQLQIATKLAPTNAEVDYLHGLVLERWQQFEPARLAYASAVAKNPDEVAYVMAQAEMSILQGRPAEALALLKTKAARFEHSGVVRDEIGLLLADTGQYDEAIAALREACILSADDATIREHLAFTLFSAKRHDEAAEVFGRLLKSPDFDGRADVHAAMAECQLLARQFADARRSYETATRLSPVTGGYWLGLGKACVQNQDLGGAEMAVRKAISLNVNSSEAYCLLGYVRLQQDQLPQSLAAFKSASELDAKDSVSVCMQGYAYARMGDVTNARSAYLKALDLDPRNQLAIKLLTGPGSPD